MIMTDTWMFFTSTLAQAVTAAAANSDVADSSHLMLLVTVFALAVFVGVEIIAKIPPTLHTPLMSGSNAISGITVIGAILATGSDVSTISSVLGFSAVVLATVNVVGGFMVTNRMLAMFKPKK
jgi:NAD(P) transhydrogenase subunit alpha